MPRGLKDDERAWLPSWLAAPHGKHVMRHFVCGNAIEAGFDFKLIAGWLGHEDGGILVARTL